MNIEKVRKHIGMSYELKLNDEVIHIPPLPTLYLPEFWQLITRMEGNKDLIKSMDKDFINTTLTLIKASCELSPDIGTPANDAERAEMDTFISKNYIELLGAVIEANTPAIASDKEKIEKLRKRYNQINEPAPPAGN